MVSGVVCLFNWRHWQVDWETLVLRAAWRKGSIFVAPRGGLTRPELGLRIADGTACLME